MANEDLIKELLTKLKQDAIKGCELKSSDYSNGNNTLNVDAAHDAILYCQENKHNDNTIFNDTRYTVDKQNDNYPGTSRQRSECVSKLEENVCYIRDSFSGVALKGYNNYLDSAGTPKKTLWHKYHFGIPIKTGEKIKSRVGITKNNDLLIKIQKHSTFLNYDKFIHERYELSARSAIEFDDCTLGLNFTWQAVLYYGYRQFLENEANCKSEEYKDNARKIIECLRQINFVNLGVSVPKWKIGHPPGGMFDNFNVSDDEGDKEWNNMNRMNLDDQTEYYFITSQSFVHRQISKILPAGYDSNYFKGFEARKEGDEDSSVIGEVDMENGMENLLTTYNQPLSGTMDKPAQIMLWQFLKFQGDSSHLVFYSIIKVATPADNPISIKILTGERPLVKRAQLEGKTIMVKKFKVFAKNWVEACSSDGRYIEFVSDPEGQAKTLLAKAVSLKQSEYYADWGDNLDYEINQFNDIDWAANDYNDKIKTLKEKMDVFGKYVIEQKIQTYIGGDFENDAEKFFKLMRPAKDGVLKPIRGAGGKQFDFGKDVDVVFSKLGFLADNYDTLNDGTNNLPTIIDRMNWIMVGRRNAVGWVDHLQCIVNSFESHEEADAGTDVNYKVLVLKAKNGHELEIDIKGLTTFVSMNYYVMNDRSIFSSSSDSYQKVFFFAKILKFFIEQAGIAPVYSSAGGAQIGGAVQMRNRRDNLRKNLQNTYKNIDNTSDLYKSVIHCYIKISEEIDKIDYSSESDETRRTYGNFDKKLGKLTIDYTQILRNVVKDGGDGVHKLIASQQFKNWETAISPSLGGRQVWIGKVINTRAKGVEMRTASRRDDYTYDQAQYDKILFKKFLDTVPHNIKLADLHKFHAQEPKKEEQMELLIPDYNADYPYTIWWLYSYIHKGAAYEDFIDLFNSKITNDTKYYFVNEENFMKWKENIKIFAKFASINKSMRRFKYEYFLENDKFKKYMSETGNKSFTELEIRDLIISTIKYSGNRVLEDLEIVYRIQDSLDEVMVSNSLTFDEVLKNDYEGGLKNGEVIDLTGDVPEDILEPFAKSVRIMNHKPFYDTLNVCISKSSLSDKYITLVKGFIENIKPKST